MERHTMFTGLKKWISGTPFEAPAKSLLDTVHGLGRPLRNAQFIYNNKSMKNEKNIIYTITPPGHLDNIGDHAQVVGIKKWFDEYFPEYNVIELDKNQTTDYISALKFLINDDDLIFLHSGGNLNDRSLWSEGARREVVKNFKDTPIIQLPQTVFFSNTDRGRRELNKSREIYNNHQDLTIIARDLVSHDYVQEYFDVQDDVYPDFALMLDREDYVKSAVERSGVLLCLRRDSESDVSSKEKNEILSSIHEANYDATQFDTTLDEKIPKNQREKFLSETLSEFAKHELVITDRFHGMIFSVITRTPCIAIDTVDHKISSSSKWFEMYDDEVRYVDIADIAPPLIEETAGQELDEFDWQQRYFSELAEMINKNSL
ncbi:MULTISPECIES: polysaccharide pyruvyl transferase family protein [unclassified Haloferax]|uniref:polysaccharide pyruvyl transferase family protein n=1 Tax=unclassified Haloferax TaxID=2625095 RepID=UPI00135F123D|nr:MULTISPECIES: polysaccharide pyruvyl transferase family protein [unclassified Haloferax]